MVLGYEMVGDTQIISNRLFRAKDLEDFGKNSALTSMSLAVDWMKFGADSGFKPPFVHFNLGILMAPTCTVKRIEPKIMRAKTCDVSFHQSKNLGAKHSESHKWWKQKDWTCFTMTGDFTRQTEMRNEYVWITRLRQKDICLCWIGW